MQATIFPETPTNTLSFHRPKLVTKDLAIGNLGGDKRRVRLSSNFLRLMGFEPGVRTIIEPLGGMNGFRIGFDSSGKTKVYERAYRQRRNNPLEAQIDIANQSLLNDTIPSYAERVHITMRQGELVFKPLANQSFSIRKKLSDPEKAFNTFLALSGGIDGYCLRETGFKVKALLEYRPQEKRDNQDLTETGALNALHNGPIDYVFNENLATIDWENVKKIFGDSEVISMLHISIPCDDYSNAKAKSIKEKHIENLDTTVDLIYDSLRAIESTQPGIVFVENAREFASSPAFELLTIKLRRWGYFVSTKIVNAWDHGGLSIRKRTYMVASVWPGFEWPEEVVNTRNAYEEILPFLYECRDVSNTLTVGEAIKTGRIRTIDQNKKHSPTLLKSQARQAKDSIYIKVGDRHYFPSENVCRLINGVPDTLSLLGCSQTIASEILGQSIDYPMHKQILLKVKEHIQANVMKPSIVMFEK